MKVLMGMHWPTKVTFFDGQGVGLDGLKWAGFPSGMFHTVSKHRVRLATRPITPEKQLQVPLPVQPSWGAHMHSEARIAADMAEINKTFRRDQERRIAQATAELDRPYRPNHTQYLIVEGPIDPLVRRK